jgi:SAM-dependent methyltransferase
MAQDGGTSQYIFGAEERRRLELIEECLDPLTTRSLDAIGVEAGWRCLELGAGGGSIARQLCRRVGPGGRVAAVDLDTRFVEELHESNLDVHRRDLVADGLPGGGYDLVHARALLMHLPNRDKFLGEMAAALRPGGWLLVEEWDVFPPLVLADGVFAEIWPASVRSLESVDAATTLGRTLPDLFDRAGLEAVEPICEVPVFRGGSPFAALLIASAAQLLPLLAAHGVTDDQLAQWSEEFADRTRWFHGFATYSVRGRAPAA